MMQGRAHVQVQVYFPCVDFRGFKSVQGSNFEGVLGLILKKLWGLTWFDAMSMSPYESPARAIHNDDDDDGDDDSL